VLLVLPFFFVGQIEERVRSGIEHATDVRVSWSDLGLTFFRDFPNPTLSFNDLTVVGTGRFASDTLASVEHFRLALAGNSLIGAVRGNGPLVVRSVVVDGPTVRLRVADDGTANWDIVPEPDQNSPETGARPMTVSLRSLEVTDGNLSLENAQTGLVVSVAALRHELSGDFSNAFLVARTRTHSEALSVRFAGVPYLTEASLDFDADFEVDMAGQRARLSDNELRLNDLVLGLDGEVARAGEDIALDLAFEAPSTEFGQILSLASSLYQQDFASLETSGSFSLDGNVTGSYGTTAFPAFALNVSVVEGSFRYPDLPLAAEAIAADIAVSNPGGDADNTVVDISRFHMEIEEQPVDASLVLRTPVSDPDADLRVQGTVDLGDVARTVKLPNSEGLSGVIVADAHMQARRSDLDNARYERVAAGGTISARDVAFRNEALSQSVAIHEATIELTPRTTELRSFDAQFGSSDVRAAGRLDNLLGFMFGQQPLTGAASFTSSHLDLDEWKSGNDLAAIPVPAMLDLTLEGTIEELVLNELEMTNARGRATVRDQRLTFENFSLQALGGRIGLDGFYETLDPTRPTFGLDLVLDSLDVAGASAAFVTVRTLAPVARHARGTFSSALSLSGALGQDLAPSLDALEGDGSLSTSRILLEGFPMLDRLSETLQLRRLSNPTVEALRSSVRIQGGRLFVEPFQVSVGGLAMTVSGSNGIDQTVDYSLELLVPRAGFAEAALSSLISRAGPLGPSLAAADPVRVTTRVTGTVRAPSLNVGLGEAAGSALNAVTQATGAAVGQRLDDAAERVDASREAARQRARAQADSILARTERQAEEIRAEAGRVADGVRADGDRAADAILARATNPIAQRAAQPAADRLRREADERAAAIEREADERATALVAVARARADSLVAAEGRTG